MANPNWTNEQKDAIFDHNHNLLVSAAAGSGKTAVLVERIIEIVKAGKANIDEMLIVTFTNAAASEMREKLLKRLSEEALFDQIDRMGHAVIGSIDSFAFSIVKRYYHIIGVDPSLRTCDNTSSALLKEEALDDLFDREFLNHSDDFIYFLDCYDKSDVSDEAVRSMILRLHNFLMSMPDPWGYAAWAVNAGDELAEKYFDFAKRRALSLLDRAMQYHAQFVKALKDAGLKELAEKAEIDLGYVQDLYASIEKKPELGFEQLEESHRSQTINLKKTCLADMEDELKAIRQHAVDIVKELRTQYGGLKLSQLIEEQRAMKKPIKIYFDLVKKFDDEYAEKKRLDKSLDFSDMNHFALRILEDKNVCEEYRKQFKFIFIDEYQDTNSVQEELIGRIARDNNLFMVGDVKQSIYKFRLAEPEIFMHYYADYKSGRSDQNRVIDLNKNFRSKENVINSVNDIFVSLMTKENCGMPYDEAAALKKGSSYDGPIDYPLELRLLDSGKYEGDDEMVSALGKAELEALQAAAIIKEYHGKMIHSDKDDCDRKLDYRDMVILLRGTRSSGEVFYRALLEAGIPVYLDRSEGYFDSMEIQVFLNLLRLINNSKLDIPLLSVLCCPVFGFSADELAAVRIYGNEVLGKKNASFSEVFFEYAKVNDKAKAFAEKLVQYKKESKILPLADFIYKVLLESGYSDFASSQNTGEQKLANLRALVDKAASFESDNLTGLAGFIRFAEILAKNSKNIDIGPAKTMGESANCVKIMTIHKSKGLEFPFVLVAGLVGNPISKKESSDFAFDKEFGCALKIVNPDTKVYVCPKFLDILNEKKLIESLAEEIRILYVAFTRAVDILVFSAAKKLSDSIALKQKTMIPGDVDSASYLLDLIYPCLSSNLIKYTNKNSLAAFKKITDESREKFREEMQEGFSKYKDKKISDFINYPYFEAELPPKKKYSVSELAEKARTGIDHYSLMQADCEEEYYYEQPKFFSEDAGKLSSAEKGTAYHAVMEHIPFASSSNDLEYIKSFIATLCDSRILSEAQSKAINPSRIKAFFDSEIGKRVIASKEVHKEAPFVMKHKYEDHTVLVQGTIDCYFEENGKYILLDYKSNYVDKDNIEEEYERLKENYKPQLKLYKDALEKISGKEVSEAALFLFGTGETISIDD